MSTLRGLVDIRQQERRTTWAAFATLLAIMTGHTLLETARDALFLSKLPADRLPWMYLVIVVLALVLARVRRTATRGAIVWALVVGALITAGFWALIMRVGAKPWILYALYAWSGLFASWVMVQFWTLLGRAHTLTQAKRLYGFIGAGAVLGGVVGAVAARAALAFISPYAMLLASAAMFVLACAPVLATRIVPSNADELAAPSGGPVSAMTTGSRVLWNNKFARHVLGVVVISSAAVTVVDFLFKARLAAAYPDSQELASHLSNFYAVTNSVALVAQIVVGPWIFRAVGVQRALLLFPALLVGAAAGVLASGGAMVTAFILKGLDGTLRYSVHKTSVELLLVPVPDGTRERVKPIIELVGGRGGQALASIAILALVAISASGTLVLGAVVVVLAVLWLANVVRIRRHYLDVFRTTLRQGGLSGRTALPDLDIGALEVLFAGLNSSRDSEVLAALELLAEQHRERLIPALILYHPSREVVLRALELFTQHRRTDFVAIADRLNAHADRSVAAASLRARTAVLPDRKLLEERLADECPQVSATALVALMAHDWIDADDADGRTTVAIQTRSWQTAVEIARTVHDLAGHEMVTPAAGDRLDELLLTLGREASSFQDIACAPVDVARPDVGLPTASEVLSNAAAFRADEIAPDLRVSLEVARAMKTRKSKVFLPILIGMLSRHELRATARATIALVPDALAFIDEAMGRRDHPREVRVHLPRTMVLFQPEAAAAALMRHLRSEADGAVRYKVLRSLVRLRRDHPTLALETDDLRRAAEAALDHAEELRRWSSGLATLDSEPVVGRDRLRAGHRLLLDLIRDKERHSQQRLFLLFELLYEESFEEIERGLRSNRPKTRASCLELVENLVRPPLRTRVLSLIDDDAPTTTAPLGYEEVLREVLVAGGSTMRTLAEYRAMELGLDTAVLGRRPATPAIESLGHRLVERVRGLVTPDPSQILLPAGVDRAPG